MNTRKQLVMKYSFWRQGSHLKRIKEPRIHLGFQWGEPFSDESSFRLKREGKMLEISGVMPRYKSEVRPTDVMRQYELARQALKKVKGSSKDAPHIRFANVTSDNELIEFVRSFGPVVATTWTVLPEPMDEGTANDKTSQLGMAMKAEQNLVELKNEQWIYQSAIWLVNALRMPEKQYDMEEASVKIQVIARLVRSWPLQWRRERKARREAPLWKVRPKTIERIEAISKLPSDVILPTRVDAQIVLSELINVFPALVFPNPMEMHSYLCYGIRPLLYALLRREFVNTFNMAICANPQCRKFFEVNRAIRSFCSTECSRQHRQREYWQQRGKVLRAKRKRGNLQARQI
jgi:hypothetical protein